MICFLPSIGLHELGKHLSAEQAANPCVFQHSGTKGVGENLYASSGGKGSWGEGLQLWMNEAKQYSYKKPGFSSATGHFTQVQHILMYVHESARAFCKLHLISSSGMMLLH